MIHRPARPDIGSRIRDAMGTRATLTSGCWALLLFACLPAHAQGLPDRPIVLGDGHVTLGGDVSWSIAPEDTGFFNYTDYERSTLRLLRLTLLATVKAGDHIEVLSEIRSENGDRPEPYALYLRVRPWTNRNLDIQVGRVPPTFGAFARRTYATDNPLIGYPLAYQYLTSIRADALPASVDELLRMRGRGWLSNFSVGNLTPGPGVPLVSAFRWDTGVQVHAGQRSARRHGIGDRRDVVESRRSPTTTAAGSSPGASRCIRSPDWSSAARPPAARSSARAPCAPPSPMRAAATSRRPPGAATSSTRATTTSSGSRPSSAAGRCRLRRPVDRIAPLRRSRPRRRADTRFARASMRRRESTIWGSVRLTGQQGGRAGTRRSAAGKSAAVTRCSAISC